MGSHGLDCSLLCTCVNGGICHHVTGACDCPDGYYGRHCQNGRCMVAFALSFQCCWIFLHAAQLCCIFCTGDLVTWTLLHRVYFTIFSVCYHLECAWVMCITGAAVLLLCDSLLANSSLFACSMPLWNIWKKLHWSMSVSERSSVRHGQWNLLL